MAYLPTGTDGNGTTHQVNEMILFGGCVSSGCTYDGTWALSYDSGTAAYSWTDLTTSADCGSGRPSGRESAALAWDGQELVLFGGVAGSTAYGDTWWLKPNTSGSLCWQQQTYATTPAARSKHRMTYNPVSGEVMLFGGQGRSGALRNDTWFYTHANGWVQCSASDPAHPCGTPPSRRCCTGLSFGDRATEISGGQFTLFGGSTGASTVVGDTWFWDKSLGWHQCTTC
jgi:hypothetical protein